MVTTHSNSGPHPVDLHVGSRVRLRRTLLGMSQEKLATALGLTFQQVQKYERAANRIGSSRLWEISQILGVPVSYFFEDLKKEAVFSGSVIGGMAEQNQAEFNPETVSNRESLELLKAYNSIGDTKVRRRILDLVRSVSITE